MSEKVIGWDTSLALSAGIECGLWMIDRGYAIRNGRWLSMNGKHWHATRGAAVACAEVMRTEKLASLEKQAEKIRKMDFSTAPTEPTP